MEASNTSVDTKPSATTADANPPTKPKKVRCHICRKKVGCVTIPCKCGKPVCLAHISPHSHRCTYDHAKECRDRILQTNPKVVPSCLAPI